LKPHTSINDDRRTDSPTIVWAVTCVWPFWLPCIFLFHRADLSNIG
jgi:hypothetical protein